MWRQKAQMCWGHHLRRGSKGRGETGTKATRKDARTPSVIPGGAAREIPVPPHAAHPAPLSEVCECSVPIVLSFSSSAEVVRPDPWLPNLAAH